MKDECLSCPLYNEQSGGQGSCERYSADCFTITLCPQELTAKQAVTAAPALRLGAMELKRRMAAEHPIYVKAFLEDALEAVCRLESAGLAYTTQPDLPRYSRFRDCPKRQRQRFHFHEAEYFRFDRARAQQWPAV